MNYFPASYLPFAIAFAPFMLLIALWSVLIKGYALWVAARAGQKWWFIALLVINTVGILELVYLIWFSPPGSNRLSGIASRMSKPSADVSSPPQA